ncbi:MAG: cbiO [Burkholderiaceae bacterium]|nr:cbiO [Burkholderiaceae bacterium]
MIELKNLCYRWPEADSRIGDLSLTIGAGEKVVLLGANGCGKSTLLKLMNGLIFADSGEVRWQGRALSGACFRQREFARSFRQQNVLLFQHPEAMLFNPTVQDEIAYGLRQLGSCTEADMTARVAHWAAELGLSNVLEQAPFNLSGGQKQKVALACLLVLEPQVMLLDEPSASLDPATAGWLVDTLVHSDKTIIASTHNLSMAAELGERCLILGRGGEILFDGPVQIALSDISLLERAGLAHRHRHRHDGALHTHVHVHNCGKG